MKIVFIGNVIFSYRTLQHLLSLPQAQVVGIVTKTQNTFNTDFFCLESIAIKNNIPCFFTDQNTQTEFVNWLHNLEPDVIYCFGWSELLKKDILGIPLLGVVGYHPAALPQNRGRHPIIWALALGLSQTASTFFFMDEGADSGDILSQVFVDISVQDDAAALYEKLTVVSLKQIDTFTHELATGTYIRQAQNHAHANYWRKRTSLDGQIDWRMSSEKIYNLVRALSQPYPGAHCLFNDKEIKIWKVEIINENILNLEPGKVLEVEKSCITVKSGSGMIKILEHEFDYLPKKGSYL